MSAVPYTFATDTGNIPLSQLDANFANVKAFADTAGYVTQPAQANITSVGTLTSASVTGNITGGNILTAGRVSATGNITGNYILGNGALLSGVITSATNINNGTSNVDIPLTSGNVSITVGTVANMAVFTEFAEFITGSIEVSNVANVAGNIRGNNYNTTGIVTATGNVIGGNILTGGLIRSSSKTSGIGYSTGAGNTVVQDTNRSTSVTINAVSGAITLYSVAGNSTYTTFTVTNSAVANTDVIIVNQCSGADKYEAFVSNVATGSFAITVSDVTGTTTEAPVLNFAVIKAVTA